MQGFNWTSPKQRLRKMAGRLGISADELPQEEIQHILDTRNSLVHKLQFYTEDKWGEYLRLVWIVDRLVIGLLEYDGFYRDARSGRRVRATRYASCP